MAGNYSVRTIIAANGERLPMLCNRLTGVPEFEPLVYVLTKYRQVSSASATIERTLREIEILSIFLDNRKINLQERLREGLALSLQEVDALVRYCALPAPQLASMGLGTDKVIPFPSRRTASTEHLRMRGSTLRGGQLSPVTIANRVRTVHAYLEWTVDTFLSSRRSLNLAKRNSIIAQKSQMLGWLDEAKPSAKRRNVVGTREGLDPRGLDRLLEVIKPDSDENPWLSEHSQRRNSLLICWLVMLGIRRGEALGVKIGDINFQKEEVLIARRADDPDDARKKKPNTKTRDRIIPMTPELVSVTHDYIRRYRRNVGDASKHSFLFVADHSGNALTLDSVNKAFRVLRNKVFDIPSDLSPHVLRHTWNDLFSDEMDANKIEESHEHAMRSYLMGWSENSPTARTYTKRTVRRRAQKASMEMQEKMMARNDKD